MNIEEKCLEGIGRLNFVRSNGPKGIAPNKPLLLLAIVDLVEAGHVGLNKLIVMDIELVLRFRAYSLICVKLRINNIDLDLTFRHLALDGIYTAVDIGEREVRIGPELLAVLLNAASRFKLRKLLISIYFLANKEVALCKLLGMSAMTSREVADTRGGAAEYKSQTQRWRGTRFTVQLISGDYFTCELNGYRLISMGGYNLLEAAHIQVHAKCELDVPENGLALIPTAYGLFDVGLWKIENDLTLNVAKTELSESVMSDDSHFRLSELYGKRLCFNPRSQHRPTKQY